MDTKMLANFMWKKSVKIRNLLFWRKREQNFSMQKRAK